MKSKRILASAALAVSLLCGVSQQAAARDFFGIYTDCGLGAMIAPQNPVIAAITNVTWDWGTTAISSNISSADTCKGGKAKTAALMIESYPSLERDIARGEGAHLSTLMAMAGCPTSAHAEVAQAVRTDFAATLEARPDLSEQGRYEQARSLHDNFYQRLDRDFSQVCQVQ